MDERDDFIGFMYFIQDVTVERQRDEYLQRMNRLIALGELAAGIAHEIRNPLTGIAVVLDILKGKKRLSRADNDLISQANDEIEGLEKLIANLLVFAKPKKFVFEFADMNDILTSICFLINEKCNKQNIELKLKLHENIQKTYMDHERIKQGLLNVVINAIQAMPKGGHLLLETDVYCENEATGRYIIVKIKDTGVGISKEDLSRIFDPFFTTHNDGTGLGLSITHSIIKKHNGVINVDSEKGKGTQVIIHLPQNHS
jgi:signal transduction histidine kinase